MDPVTHKHLNMVSFVTERNAWRFIAWEFGVEKQGSGLLRFFIKSSLWEQRQLVFLSSSNLKAAVYRIFG